MTSTTPTSFFPSAHHQQPQLLSSIVKTSLSASTPSAHHRILRPITATISESPPSMAVPPAPQPAPVPFRNLQLKKIPGDHGLPLIGPFNDRLDYFYNQGRDEFFKSRARKYKSTVFRTNMPPGPFIAADPRVIVLLDGKSFPILFDVTKVEKKDLFTGTFMPSTDLTGGFRVLSYLDPSEIHHAKLKKLIFSLLKSRREYVLPEFSSTYNALFDSLESDIVAKGKANFAEANDQAAFNFLSRALYGADPKDTELGLDGPKLIGKWVLFQLSPLLSLGLPKMAEDLSIHTFRLPPSAVKKDYERLYGFFSSVSGSVQAEAKDMGISKEEACHNLLFATCFNSFGGMKFMFTIMMKWLGRSGTKLHTELAQEVRSVIRSNGGSVSMGAIEQMELVKSVVYECLRIEPPVSLQYGRAKRDLIVESHDAAFQVKEGELLLGYQPFATKDPRIFDRAEEFVGDRFMGEEGERLLKHVVWSNGPETQNPTLGNKQCAGKDFVVLVARLLVVELFLRYDSFDIEVGSSPLGASVTLTSLKKASF